MFSEAAGIGPSLSWKQMREIWRKTQSGELKWSWEYEDHARCSDDRLAYGQGYVYLTKRSFSAGRDAYHKPFTLSALRFALFMWKLKKETFPEVRI